MYVRHSKTTQGYSQIVRKRERQGVIHVLTAFVNKGKIEKNVCSKVKEKTDKQAKTKRVQHTQVKKDREVNI
jgi:hypothetical protein